MQLRDYADLEVTAMTGINSSTALNHRHFSLEDITRLHYKYPTDFFGEENGINVRLAKSVIDNRDFVAETLKSVFLKDGIGVPYYIIFKEYEKTVASRVQKLNNAYDLFRGFFEMIVGLYEHVSDMIVNGYASEKGIITSEIQQNRPLDFKPEKITGVAEKLTEQVSKRMPKATYYERMPSSEYCDDVVDGLMRFLQQTINSEGRSLRYAVGATTLMSLLPVVINAQPAYAQINETKWVENGVRTSVSLFEKSVEKCKNVEKGKPYNYVEIRIGDSEFGKSGINKIKNALEEHNISLTFANRIKDLQKYFPSSKNIFSGHNLWVGKKYVVDMNGGYTSQSLFIPEKFLTDTVKIQLAEFEKNPDVVFHTRRAFPDGTEQYVTHKLNSETGEYSRIEGERFAQKKASLISADEDARKIVLGAYAKGIITSIPKKVLDVITRTQTEERSCIDGAEEKAEKVSEQYPKQLTTKEYPGIYTSFERSGKPSSETIDAFVCRLNNDPFFSMAEEEYDEPGYTEERQKMFSQQLRIAGLEAKIDVPEATQHKTTPYKGRETLYKRARQKLDSYKAMKMGFAGMDNINCENFKLDRCYVDILDEDEKLKVVNIYNNRDYKTLEDVAKAVKEELGLKTISKASIYKILRKQKNKGMKIDYRSSEKFRLNEEDKVAEIARFYKTKPEIISKVLKHCEKNDVNPYWIFPLINQESGFNKYATSSAGAMGLMQLMPETAKSLGVKNPYNADENLDGGIRYFKQQFKKFGSITRVLAAYNAGPGAVLQYKGVPPYSETINYVESISSGNANLKKWVDKRVYHLKMIDENKEL